MEIIRNKYVSLTYELKTGGFEGEVIDSAVEESPLSFVYGAGLMLEKFEENLLGLKKGDKFRFEIASHEGYGPADDNRVVDLPKEIFEVDGKIDTEMVSVGNTLPMMDAQGNRMNGKIIDITDENVVMDFNHPLAAENLYFVITSYSIHYTKLYEPHACGSPGPLESIMPS